MQKFFVLFYVLILPYLTNAQVLTGIIKDNKDSVVIGAQVSFQESGNGTVTDQYGGFILQRAKSDNHLIIQFPGYNTDTLFVPNEQEFVQLKIIQDISLQPVEISGKRESYSFSIINPLNIETLNSEEFRKAACCTLAESFQTSNTVDLSFSNAVTGNREIQFLGLRGIYVQQLVENRPVFTGIMANLGYDYISGTWIDKVNILKGSGNTNYGLQGFTGAINVGLKKPDTDYPAFINLFGDLHGRIESNVHLNHSWNKKDHSGFYLQYIHHDGNGDHNHDGFRDDPKQDGINMLLRNTFYGHRWEGQANVQFIADQKTAGQTSGTDAYIVHQQINHINAFGNLGYVGFKDKSKSFGSVWDLSFSNLDYTLGKSNFPYQGKELHGLGELLFQIDKDLKAEHQLTFGTGVNLNLATEHLYSNSEHEYNELTPNILLDYNIKLLPIGASEIHRLVFTISQRLDYIKLEKLFYSPRTTIKYNIDNQWALRLSAGNAYRLPRYYADNISQFYTGAKNWVSNFNADYESAWTYTLGFVGKPQILLNEWNWSLDANMTDFKDQMVFNTIYPNGIRTLELSNENAEVFSLQSTLQIPLNRRISLRTGGKYTDSKTEYNEGKLPTRHIPKWRSMANLEYSSRNKILEINLTGNYIGKMPLYNLTESKPYALLQLQINYNRRNFEWYGGCENILNYTQHHAIHLSDNPFSQDFDASNVYAPINGIKPYIGLRWKIIHNKNRE